MRIQLGVAGWALAWCGLFLSTGLILGEVPFFFWPHLVMLWLGWETYLGFGAAIALGGTGAVALAWWCERRKIRGVDRLPALWGLLCLLVSVGLQMLVAWNAAMLMNRPMGP